MVGHWWREGPVTPTHQDLDIPCRKVGGGQVNMTVLVKVTGNDANELRTDRDVGMRPKE
jgi:hypothetical protein